MVYNLPVKRDNAIYDDTCRRDFPMNKLQKLMCLIGSILNISFIGFIIISLIIFILILIYLLIRYLSKQKSNKIERQLPIKSTIIKDEKPMIKIKRSAKPHGYLWHDDMI
jgi:large-conductance mechanosensitive channel